MIRQIVKDEMFLSQKSETATKADVAVITDLIDTLRANAEHCVGMAANMIGVTKRIIEIGRASSRERVCQYVESWVVRRGGR